VLPKQKETLNYEKFEGMHIFKREGRLMHGPNPKNLIVTVVVINLTNLIALPVIQRCVLVQLVLWALIDYFLITTALADPGIVPRQQTKEKTAEKYKTRIIMNGAQSHILELKYCKTCYIYRPPGCSPTENH
jgi:hypothetical protein